MTTTGPLALDLALASAALLGFRHGFDYDHVAAISDIAALQRDSRQAMKLGLIYVIGHAATVAVLGIAVIFLQRSLPTGMDEWMEHLVGATLVLLGITVLWTAMFRRHTHEHRPCPRTRITILIDAIFWCVWRVRRAFTSKPIERYRAFGNGMGKTPAIVVGVIHGLGAETPSQLALFLLAANLGGVGKGILGLAAFLAGMLAMNTLLCAGTAGLLRIASHRQSVFQWVAGLSAVYSVAVGVVFLAGTSAVAAALGR